MSKFIKLKLYDTGDNNGDDLFLMSDVICGFFSSKNFQKKDSCARIMLKNVYGYIKVNNTVEELKCLLGNEYEE